MGILESLWGTFTPTNLGLNPTKTKEETQKFQACLFLCSVSLKRYGKVIDELNNDFITGGQEHYPDCVEDAVTMLSFRVDRNQQPIKVKQSADNYNPMGLQEKSFAQAEKDGKVCYCCGENGHISQLCDKKKTIPYEEWHINKVSHLMQTKPHAFEDQLAEDNEGGWFNQ